MKNEKSLSKSNMLLVCSRAVMTKAVKGGSDEHQSWNGVVMVQWMHLQVPPYTVTLSSLIANSDLTR